MLTLTESAVFRLQEMMQEAGETRLRFGVVGGGCTGLSYVMGFAEEEREGDCVVDCEGIQVVVNETDIPVLKGTVVDFKQSMMGGGFAIENPNAIASCGCGSSFRTKTVKGTPENC